MCLFGCVCSWVCLGWVRGEGEGRCEGKVGVAGFRKSWMEGNLHDGDSIVVEDGRDIFRRELVGGI